MLEIWRTFWSDGNRSTVWLPVFIPALSAPKFSGYIKIDMGEVCTKLGADHLLYANKPRHLSLRVDEGHVQRYSRGAIYYKLSSSYSARLENEILAQEK